MTGKLLRSQGARLVILHPPFETHKREHVLENDYGNLAKNDITTHECDITSIDSVNKAFSGFSDQERLSSILAICSGYVSLDPAESVSTEEIVKNLHVNILGPTLLSQAFAKMYWARKAAVEAAEHESGPASNPVAPGRIVSIASQAAHVALKDHAAYCASKAGLLGLTRSLALEWGPRGITANSVSPTAVLVGLGKVAWADTMVRNAFLSQVPTARFPEPEEIAQAVAYLCRDDAGSVNGADLRVDGGYTIR